MEELSSDMIEDRRALLAHLSPTPQASISKGRNRLSPSPNPTNSDSQRGTLSCQNMASLNCHGNPVSVDHCTARQNFQHPLTLNMWSDCQLIVQNNSVIPQVIANVFRTRCGFHRLRSFHSSADLGSIPGVSGHGD